MPKVLAGVTQDDYFIYLTTLLAASLALDVIPLDQMRLVLDESERRGMDPDAHIRELIDTAIAFRAIGHKLNKIALNRHVQ